MSMPSPCLAPPVSDPMSRVLIAEPNRIYAEALSRICAEVFPLARLEVRCRGQETLAALRQDPAGMLLLSLGFEDIDGVHLLNQIGAERLAGHILVISARWEEHLLLALRTARFDGAVDTASESIAAVQLALHRIIRGEAYISTTLRRYLLDDLPDGPAARELTPAELRVLRVIGDGSDNQEAADQLGLSTATVQTHRRNIMRKLRVSTSAKLVREAVRLGIVRIAPVTGPRIQFTSPLSAPAPGRPGFNKTLPKLG
jgi:two-component system nitrate/nitrite response regulator NarL